MSIVDRTFFSTSSEAQQKQQQQQNASDELETQEAKKQEGDGEVEAKPKKMKFMEYFHKYGVAFLVTEVGLSVFTTGVLYIAIRSGVDVENLLSSLHDWLKVRIYTSLV